MTDRKSATRGSGKGDGIASPRAKLSTRKAAAPATNKTSRKNVAGPVTKEDGTKAVAPGPSAPLLAHTPKRVSKANPTNAKAPKPDAPYQPKTELPPAGHNSRKPMPIAAPAAVPGVINPLAVTTPWIRLGIHMALAVSAMQTRMALAALSSPAAALSQSRAAFNAWQRLIAPKE